nr:hypothetical protein [uncultured Flavobacterium sp.]
MRFILSFLLLLFFSCEEKKNEEVKPNTIVKNSVLNDDSISRRSNAPLCINHLIDIVQSNSRCKELILNMKIQNVKYAFQIDSTAYISRTYPEDSLKYYELTLVEKHPTHNRNAAFYKFDPFSKQLYILDMVEAEYIETDCDMKLIDIYKKICQK